jgi:tetratricopeptide (TPR) repeat protein
MPIARVARKRAVTPVTPSPTIKALIKAFLDARFEKAQAISKPLKWKAVIARALAESPEDMTAVSMSVELLDYFGQTPLARKRLEELAPRAESRLREFVDRKGEPLSPAERSIVKRWVWILLQSASLDYRDMVLDRAEPLCQLCLTAINKLRVLPSYACFGTLSRIHYVMGLIHRERFNYPDAKSSFQRSLGLAWESLREKQGAGKEFRQSRWTDVTIARASGLGLGYVYHMDGQPDLAIPVLLSAKTMLARAGDTLLSNYVDLVYLDARRSAYGGDALPIDDAIEGLERCYKVFESRKHRLYCARAAYSLALAYSERARPDETKELTKQGWRDLERASELAMLLSSYAPADGAADRRHMLYARLCMSRIHRKAGRLPLAVETATAAIEDGGRAYNHIYAGLLIARAEAYLRLKQQDDAITDLNEALAQSKHSLRARAVCLLRLTEIHANLGHRTKAIGYFHDWKQISPHVSNVHLRSLEKAARAALNADTADFRLEMSAKSIDCKHEMKRLKWWLFTWATRDGAPVAEVMKRLDISDTSVANWKRKAEEFERTSASSASTPKTSTAGGGQKINR